MVDHKEVVLAILGASTAFAGFVLVFLGLVVSSFQSYSGAIPAEVTRPYRTTAVILFTTFCLALVTVAVCIGWVLTNGADDMYRLALGLFLVQLLALLGSAGWALRLVLEWP